MESKGHSAAFLEIRKKSYLDAVFHGPRAIWLGCKLNPREYKFIGVLRLVPGLAIPSPPPPPCVAQPPQKQARDRIGPPENRSETSPSIAGNSRIGPPKNRSETGPIQVRYGVL